MTSRLILPTVVFEEIAAHARADRVRECCGLLIGAGDQVVEVVPTPNVSPDPSRRYEIAPAAYLAQIKRCRASARGLSVLGSYHSHPRSRPIASDTDAAAAFRDFVFLIVGPADESLPFEVRAYQLVDGAMHPLSVIITGGDDD